MNSTGSILCCYFPAYILSQKPYCRPDVEKYWLLTEGNDRIKGFQHLSGSDLECDISTDLTEEIYK